MGASPLRPRYSFYPKYPSFLKYGAVADSLDPDGVRAGVFADSAAIGAGDPLPLDWYVDQQKNLEKNAIWGSYARKYTVAERPDQVTRLLKRYTSITLPVNIPLFATIFGKPEISVSVSGSADVHVSVRSDYTNLTSISALGSRQTAPAFSQDLNVNLNAKIGDKLNLTADWNTLRTFDFENLLKLKYSGHEDDIVQNVEAGNVTLQTPSQLISGSQALFGVKVGTQFGPFFLTTLASQKKGETKRVTLTGAQAGGIAKHVWEYSPNHYFLDGVYRNFYNDYYGWKSTPQPPITARPYRVLECEVWVPTTDKSDKFARFGIAIDTISSIPANAFYPGSYRTTTPQLAGSVEATLWRKLDRTQFTYNADIGVININDGVQYDAIAVAYRIAGTDGAQNTADDRVYGSGTLTGQPSTNPTDTILLKLVRPKMLVPGYKTTWPLQIRSIYSLGAPNVKPAGVDVNITYFRGPGDSSAVSSFKGANGQPLRWITVTGLDKTNGAGGDPDQQFDQTPGLMIDTARGELIFPDLAPFSRATFRRQYSDPASGNYADSVGFDRAYDTLSTAASADQVHDRFLINLRVQGAQGSVIRLNAFNITPGSVRVSLNGAGLTQGVDYTVDEFGGTVTLRNQQALQPGANVQVEFEQHDIFSASTKTLLGARGDYAPSKSTKLGFTLFNYNQKIFTDKIRLGEEPISNLIMGLDGSTVVPLQFLSKALGLIPGQNSRAKSSLTVRGEVAYVVPSAAGGNSNISVDGSEGTALLDDFEGARYSIPLAGSYGFWHYASPPAVNENHGTQIWTSGGLPDSDKVPFKSRLTWYNIIPSDVLTTEIFPRRSVARPSEATTVLNMTFDPRARGVYNIRPSLGSDPRYVWGGATRVIYNTPTDLTAQNITDLEIWFKVLGNVPATGKMYLDLGLISEDIIPNGRLDTEDGIIADYPQVNGILNPGEDVGIDGLADEQEKIRYAAEVAASSGVYPDMINDPNGDDWGYSSGSRDYTRINGLEGNSASEFGRSPDTEDLNGNNTLDGANSYFEYEIELDTVNNPQKIGAGTNGWTQLRVPLRQFARIIGSPTFQNVQYVRIWFAGFTEPVTVRFANIDLVGSRWQRLVGDTSQVRDTTLSVSFVNYEDNSGPPDSYYSPAGVTRARNPYITDHVVYENEQSLSLKVQNLAYGEDRQAIRYESGVDLFSYKGLALFLHGDETQNTVQYIDTAHYNSDVFLRFGTDTVNYYEYRQPLTRGWSDVRIPFADITAIKALRDSAAAMQRVFRVPAMNHPPGSSYAVRGNPTATRIQYFSLGVSNPRGKTTGNPLLTTTVWADELRLVGSVNTSDWAALASAALQLGDIAQVQLTGTQNNPDFHRMDSRFGDRVRHQQWSVAAQTGVEKVVKFVPGLSIPLVYSHTEEIHQPRYLAQSDVLVDGAVQQTQQSLLQQGVAPDIASAHAGNIRTVSQTLRVTDAYALQGIKLPIPVKHWLIDDTWNRITLGFDYNTVTERSPVVEHRQEWNWRATATYALQIKPVITVKPITWSTGVPLIGDFKEWRINFLPTTFNAGLAFVRGHIDQKDRGIAFATPTIRQFSAVRSAGFTWPFTDGGMLNPSLDYSLSVASTMLPLELDELQNERAFSDIFRRMFFYGRVFNLGRDSRVDQTVTLTLKPRPPHILSIERYTDFTTTYSSNYGWTDALTSGDIGKGATVSSKLTLGATLKLRLLTDEWFGYSRSGARSLSDTSMSALGAFVKYGIKAPFFDFDAITINFNQTNTSKNPGLVGGTGVNNFWAATQRLSQGPNRLYQLGLISSPDGNVGIRGSSRFPFFAVNVTPGRRAAFGSFADNFKQDNSLDLRTQRELWTGAQLTLSWKSQWVFNSNQSITTDSLGVPSLQSALNTIDVTRSYLTMPPFLFLGIFNNTVSSVVGKYQQSRGVIESNSTLDSSTRNTRRAEALADAFENGFEALGFLPRAIQQVLPRVNWTFRWDGLEKLPFLEPFAQRVSLEHTYNSNYTRRFQSNPTGGYSTQGQSIAMNFQPLLGITMSMKEKVVGGNMSATARYNTSTTWTSQGSAAGTITKDLTSEVSVTATYTRQGLPFSLFGLKLKNDLEASFTLSSQSKSSRTFDVNDFKADGTPLDGSTTITAEPRVRYTISQRVQASLFYRLRRTIPDASGSKVPETSTIEAGIDLHVSISGGQ
jgi:hypothetical protein